MACALHADFRRREHSESLVERARKVTGDLDILVNSASTSPAARLIELECSGFTVAMAVNAWVPLTLCRTFVRGLARVCVVNLLDTHLEHSGLLPLHSHGDVQPVAEAVLFLLQTEFIIGPVLYVDGSRPLYGAGSPRHPGDA